MTLEAHPVADLFPLMSGDEFDRLVADIAANGQREPIWLHPDGRIVDGRNRYAACLQAGVEPRTRQWDGKGSLVEFVVSLNLHRRHLSASQKAMIAVEVVPLLAEENRQLISAARARAAEQRRVPPVVGQQSLEQTSTFGHLQPAVDTLREAGRLVGAARSYVAEAKNLATKAPDIAARVRSGELSIPEAKKEIRQAEKAERVAAIAAREPAPLDSTGPFPVLYADPPWRYDFAEDQGRQIENHYPTLTLDELVELSVPVADDAVLFLWATSPKLLEALDLMQAWGFEYRTSMVWVKDRIGMGYYARQQHELLLIGRRGSLPVPDPEDRPPSVISAPRGQHSEKPDAVYELIERMYPLREKCELFQRRPRNGWAGWGNQAGAA